jgi:hypothetical protein
MTTASVKETTLIKATAMVTAIATALVAAVVTRR